MTLKLKLAAIGLIAFGGWTARGWFEDSKDLVALEAQQALAEELREGQRKIASQVEERLGELQANERIIERGVIREIEKPIYQRVCLEPDAMRLLNAAAKGDAPGEPAGEVSELSAPAD